MSGAAAALPARREVWWRWLLRRPARGVLCAGLVGLLTSVLLTFAVGFPPAPAVHDEFSNLLASDTFTHGRLTNTTPAAWQHFESFHILLVPSYASKYPPVAALLLALGQRLTGAPIVGVWIGYALMCAAVTWMLQAWTRPRWALWGGVLAALWFAGVHVHAGYWAASYWGGAPAAIGGALLLGGVRRLGRSDRYPATSTALAVAAGLAVLANTRPFEGLLAALPSLGVLAVWPFMRSARRGHTRRAVVVPLALALAGVGAAMAYDNYRVTGNALRFPYMDYTEQYETTPLLLGITSAKTHTYRHQVMTCFYTVGAGHAAVPRTVRAFLRGVRTRSQPFLAAFFPIFALPLVFGLPGALRRDRPWLPVATFAAVLVGFAVNPWYMLPHYAAPAAAAFIVLVTLAARRLATFRVRRYPAGKTLVRLVMVMTLASAAVSAAAFLTVRPQLRQRWLWQRQEMQARLAATGQRHLVLVSYGPRHNPDREWVYNAADIPHAPVIWARSMGPAADSALLRAYAGRQVWTLDIVDDDGPFTLRPLAASGNAGGVNAAADSGTVTKPSDSARNRCVPQ